MSRASAMFRSELTAAIQAAHAPETTPAHRPADVRPAPHRPPHRTVVRLWLPLTPLWLILSPFAILAAPLLLLAPRMRVRRPFRAVFALGRTLLALSGTVVDVDTPDALVRIRIF
jgi:hypothetical protein